MVRRMGNVETGHRGLKGLDQVRQRMNERILRRGSRRIYPHCRCYGDNRRENRCFLYIYRKNNKGLHADGQILI